MSIAFSSCETSIMDIEHNPAPTATESLLYAAAFLCVCIGAAVLGWAGIQVATYADTQTPCTSSIRSDELQPALTDFERKLLGK